MANLSTKPTNRDQSTYLPELFTVAAGAFVATNHLAGAPALAVTYETVIDNDSALKIHVDDRVVHISLELILDTTVQASPATAGELRLRPARFPAPHGFAVDFDARLTNVTTGQPVAFGAATAKAVLLESGVLAFVDKAATGTMTALTNAAIVFGGADKTRLCVEGTYIMAHRA